MVTTIRWFADNSELTGLRGSTLPDILMFGGICASHDVEIELCNRFEGVKDSYFGNHRAPVKWNVKDLRPLYKKQGQLKLYQTILESSREWRSSLFDSVSDLEFTTIVAIVESYAPQREHLRKVKDGLCCYSFNNGLMRYALYIKDMAPDFAEVVLDWPDGGKSNPFDTEYRTAYRVGRTGDGSVSYHSGPLCELSFRDSVLYTRMAHSSMLQLSDLILGATREFVEVALKKKESGQGADCVKTLLHRYRGYPNHIVQRGLSVPSGNTKLRNAISGFVRRTVNELQRSEV